MALRPAPRRLVLVKKKTRVSFGPQCLSMLLARYNNSFRQLSGSDPPGKASPGGALNQLGAMKIAGPVRSSEFLILCFFTALTVVNLMRRRTCSRAHVHRLYAPRLTAVHGANPFWQGRALTRRPPSEGAGASGATNC